MRKAAKQIVKFVFIFIIFAIFAIFTLPTLASNGVGKFLLLKIYTLYSGNFLEIEKADLNWLKGQELTSISYKDKSKNFEIYITHLKTDAALWQLVFYQDLGNLSLTSPSLTLKAGSTKFEENVDKVAIFYRQLLPYFQHPSSCCIFPFLGHLNIRHGSCNIVVVDEKTHYLETIDAEINIFKEQIKAQLKGKSFENHIEGSFDCSLAYRKRLKQKPYFDIQSHLKGFPVEFFDQFIACFSPSLKGSIVQHVGHVADADLYIHRLADQAEFQCLIKSPDFYADLEFKEEENHLVLLKPAFMRFRAPSAFFDPIPWLKIQDDCPLSCKIDGFRLPLDHKENLSFQATIKGQASSTFLSSSHPFSVCISTLNLSSRRFDIKLDSTQAKINTTVYLPQEVADIAIEGQGLFPGHTQVNIAIKNLSSILVNIEGDFLKTQLVGGYCCKTNSLFLKDPAIITCILNPQWGYMEDFLENPVYSQWVFQPFEVCLLNNSGIIALDAHIQPFQTKTGVVRKCDLSLKGYIHEKKLQYHISTQVDEGQCSIFGTTSSLSEVSSHLLLKKFPTHFLGTWMQEPEDLNVLLGPDLNGSLEILHSPQKDQIQFSLFSDLMNWELSLERDGSYFHLSKPSKLSLNLQPQGYATLQKFINLPSKSYPLLSPLIMKVELTSLMYPVGSLGSLKDYLSLDLASLGYAAKFDIHSPSSTGKNPVSPQTWEPFSLSFSHLPFSPIELYFSAGKESHFEALFNKQTQSLVCQGELKKIPYTMVDILLPVFVNKKIFPPLRVNDAVNISIETSIINGEGPFTIQWNSGFLDLYSKGFLSKESITLKHPLFLKFKTVSYDNPFLKFLFRENGFQDVVPIDSVTLEIEPEGFYCPLEEPFKKATLHVEYGKLCLGKSLCHQSPYFEKILHFLKLNETLRSRDFHLYFSPISFNIHNGILNYDRLDMLIEDAYQLCSWGKIHFINREIDTILGVTASCLRKMWGIEDLPPTYVLAIPIQGSFQNPNFHLNNAASKIAQLLLLTKNQLLKEGTSSPLYETYFFEDIPTSIPPPHSPLPWEQKF